MSQVIDFGDVRLPRRFWKKVHACPITGCWLWTASLKPAGYGEYFTGIRVDYAHRASYATLVAPIGAGMQIDHLCRVRACCNPLHLEQVTQRQNILRGTSISARNAAKTHCKRGHELSPDNVRIHKRGFRNCRACDAGSKRDAAAEARLAISDLEGKS